MCKSGSDRDGSDGTTLSAQVANSLSFESKWRAHFCSLPEHFFWSHTHSGGRKIAAKPLFRGLFRGLRAVRFSPARAQKTRRTRSFQTRYWNTELVNFEAQHDGHKISTKSLLFVFMWERLSRLCAGANEMADSARQFTHQSLELARPLAIVSIHPVFVRELPDRCLCPRC